ncbi:heavy metal translocating P-type ATPase metal-binding domain-containing protein [Halobellus salinisoli]|uniref:heavy metal translocating P-type ATPase metal-binding domain-containing protein n=1 Tax=Halobellus salinisoli TaxID=3108500 RepID=UPI0031F2DBBE
MTVENNGRPDRDSSRRAERNDCTHCGLPTPTPPITAADVEGSYCCRGCLAVARALESVGDETSHASE